MDVTDDGDGWMKSFVVVEKRVERSGVDDLRFKGFDVCEGEVEGALFTCTDSELERVMSLIRAYEEYLLLDAERAYKSDKSLAFVEDRIERLLGELFDEIPLFGLCRMGERREMWFRSEMNEMVEVLSGDGVYGSSARESESESGIVRFASGDGDYYVVMSRKGFEDSSVDFNPRGLGFISVVDNELLDEMSGRYAAVYAGEKMACEKIKRLMFCIGKRAGLRHASYEEEASRLASLNAYCKEISELTGVALETIEAKLEAITV